MNHENKFSVSRFRNRNGVFSYRVDGRLNGVRIRRNFKTQEEAATEKAALELKSLQIGSNLQAVVTCLAEEQVREAEAAFRRLAGNERSLAFYLDFALSNYCEPVCPKPLSEAAEGYLAVKTLEHHRQVISAPQLTTIRRHLEVLKAHFPGATVAELSAQRLTEFLQHGNPALNTYNNRRGVVSTFLKFAFQQDWIAVNPIEKVAYHRIAHRRGSAPTLSAKQAREIMTYGENYRGGALVPFFALCLFAGIRPCVRTGEILKLRPEHVRLDTGVIHIEPEVSKVRMKRNVTIQPNLATWLQAYPLDRFPIVIPALQKHRARVAKQFGLSHDVMRHTFISFFIAKFRSMGEAALQAGNSESIIRRHYLDLKCAAEAEEFFNILPNKAIGSGLAVIPTAPRPAPSMTIGVQRRCSEAA
jgi:integrase